MEFNDTQCSIYFHPVLAVMMSYPIVDFKGMKGSILSDENYEISSLVQFIQ